MSETLDPAPLFALIADHVPADLLPHILVVGSLAAAYHFRDQLAGGGVNTKDADFVIQPAGAIAECRAIAGRLLEAGWRRHEKCHAQPAPEPLGELRAIRLYPPTTDFYFVELLGLPETGQPEIKSWVPIELVDGWYGLPTFRYMGLTRHGAHMSAEGLLYAAPEMMALANLLSHPEVGSETMSAPIGNRTLRRASKDLGRVLGLAQLTDPEEVEEWPTRWEAALRAEFPNDGADLARHAGDGLRMLISTDEILDEARHALDVGLLAGRGVTADQLRAVGRQLRAFALDPLAARFAPAPRPREDAS